MDMTPVWKFLVLELLLVCQGEFVCQEEMKGGRVKKQKSANWKDKIIGKKSLSVFLQLPFSIYCCNDKGFDLNCTRKFP